MTQECHIISWSKLRPLRNPKFHNHFQKDESLEPILIRVIPVHALTR